MRKENIVLFISVIVVSLLCIGAISATDVSSDVQNQSVVNDNTILNENNDDSFTDLNNKVIDDDTCNINLDSNYTYYDTDSNLKDTGIVINKDLTIKGADGADVTIDAKDESKIFVINKGVTVTLDSLTFKNANSDFGSAITNYGTLILKNCSFINNTAVSRGAGVYNGNGFVTVSGSTFDGNDIVDRSRNVDNGGAAIFNMAGTVVVSDSRFTNNLKDLVPRKGNAGDLVDAVVCSIDGNVSVADSEFVNNSGCYGAAIYSGSYSDDVLSNLTVVNSNFVNNTALFGNCIFADFNTVLNVDSCSFVNNTASGIGSPGTDASSGAAISGTSPKSVVIKNSLFENNTAKQGGAIKIVGSFADINNCSFVNNTAKDLGGAIIGINTELNVKDSKFIDNTAENYAGAIFNSTSPLSLENNTFINNTPYDFYGFDSNIKIIVNNIVYGKDAEILVNLTGYNNIGLNKTVKVTVNGKEYEVDTTDGIGKLIVSGLAINPNVEVLANFPGDGEYKSSSASSTFSVSQYDINIIIDVDENGTVIVKLFDKEGNPIADAPITYSINGTDAGNLITDVNGTASVNDLVGKMDFAVNYAGNESYLGSSASDKIIIVVKAPVRHNTQIVSSDFNQMAVDFYNGERGGYFTVVLRDVNGTVLANKPVSIGFNGVVYNVTTDEKGVAKLQINLAWSGIYTFAVAFLGDDDYTGSFVVNKITITKKPTVLSVPAKTFGVYNKNKVIVVTLKGKKAIGNSYVNAVGRTVKVTVNGKTYTAKTNSKGVANIKVSINKRGTYTVTTRFAGDSLFEAKTTTSKLYIK
ncbi:hypothetical protein BGI41_06465 [Methanobrevibacter sp. 87.7]|uniref:hypothetical protein n=1 Tax=Methanobrevibacter sp. 87.7 TaxID=387957 RepID=UPI000B504620|nr:hypothetical protein [Methanobrevibacter sp. 87.7]OWT32672.1 hypothetical protein BGI41_06465 [Methanobrevibacter sp. 87.7]